MNDGAIRERLRTVTATAFEVDRTSIIEATTTDASQNPTSQIVWPDISIEQDARLPMSATGKA